MVYIKIMINWDLIREKYMESIYDKVSDFRRHGKAGDIDMMEIQNANWFKHMKGMNIKKRKAKKLKAAYTEELAKSDLDVTDVKATEKKIVEVTNKVAKELEAEPEEKKSLLEMSLKEFNSQVTYKVSRKALAIIAKKLETEGADMSIKDLLAIYKETKEIHAHDIDLENFELSIPVTLKKVLKGEIIDVDTV